MDGTGEAGGRRKGGRWAKDGKGELGGLGFGRRGHWWNRGTWGNKEPLATLDLGPWRLEPWTSRDQRMGWVSMWDDNYECGSESREKGRET